MSKKNWPKWASIRGLIAIIIVMGIAVSTENSLLKASEMTEETKDNTLKEDNDTAETIDLRAGEQWLPEYRPGLGIGDGGWLDAKTNIIPKDYSFVMRWIDGKTTDGLAEGDHSSGVSYPSTSFPQNTSYVDFRIGDGPQWIKFRNVGYYFNPKTKEGTWINLKLIITPRNVTNNQAIGHVSINNDDDLFLNVTTNPRGCNSMDVRFEFYDDDDFLSPIEVSGYWSLGTLQIPKIVTVEKNLIKNIYSLSRTDAAPIAVAFSEDTDKFQFLGVSRINLLPIATRDYQLQATVTYQSDYFQYSMETDRNLDPNANKWQVSYSQEAISRIRIPDPIAEQRQFKEIISPTQGILTNDNSVEKLSRNFYQNMPWESKIPALGVDNRTQDMNWQINSGESSNSLKSIMGISALDNLNLPSNEFFTFDGLPIGQSTDADGILRPSAGQIQQEQFYNHLYNIHQALEVQYNHPVAKSILQDLDSGKYEILDDSINLSVDNVGESGDQKGKTAINFYAPIEYRYQDSITGQEIAANKLPATAKAIGDGIVTWDVPLTPQYLSDESYTASTVNNIAPAVNGYIFQKAELNGQLIGLENNENRQVKVTKLLKSGGNANEAADYTENNVVTLYYQAASYDIDIQVVGPKGNLVEANARPAFEVQTGGSNTWVPLDNLTFDAIGTEYKIRQVAEVSPFYEQTQQVSPSFSMKVDDQGIYQLTTNGTSDDYSFEWNDSRKVLIIKVINQPKGDITLLDVEPLDYGRVSLPQKNPDTVIERTNQDWQINYTDTRPEEYRTNIQLKAVLTKDFTNQNGQVAKGILAFTNEPGIIIPQNFLVLNQEIDVTNELNPNYGTNAFRWDARAGFLLQIDQVKETKINKGNYEADITFILADDPL